MKAASFDYSRPHSVAEACGLLAAGEELAKPMAGGQSFGPMLNLRLAQPAAVIDLGAIEGLREARERVTPCFWARRSRMPRSRMNALPILRRG